VADPEFKVRGGGCALKKIAPSGGGRENFWGISCENHDFTPKNHIFSNFRGGAPPLDPPQVFHFVQKIVKCIMISYHCSFYQMIWVRYDENLPLSFSYEIFLEL
jgi:hypothetical protein